MIDRLQKWVKCNFLSPLIGIHGRPHWRLRSRDFYDPKALLRLGFLNVGMVQYYVPSPYCITEYGITLYKTIYSQLRTTCEVHDKIWK